MGYPKWIKELHRYQELVDSGKRLPIGVQRAITKFTLTMVKAEREERKYVPPGEYIGNAAITAAEKLEEELDA